MSEDNESYCEPSDEPNLGSTQYELTHSTTMNEIITELIRLLLTFPKNESDCEFCSRNRKEKFCTGEGDLEDLYVLYAQMLSCLTHHCISSSAFPAAELFLIDKFVLDCVRVKEPVDVDSALKTLHMTNRVDDKSSSCAMNVRLAELTVDKILQGPIILDAGYNEKLLDKYNDHFTDKLMKINCEQDVESLMYKWYKKLDTMEMGEVATELLLYTLYVRNEFVRFFRIYEKSKNTGIIHRLAILGTLDDRCHRKRLNGAERAPPLSEESNSLLSTLRRFVIQNMGGLSEPLDFWVEKQREAIEWKRSVDVWSKSRKDNTGAVDNAMIELCDRNMRWEEGWMIYKDSGNQAPTTLHKVCILCVNAMKQTLDRIWVERLVEITESVIRHHKPELCCALTDDVITKLGNLPEELRKVVLRKFFKMISSVNEESEVVNTLLKDLVGLCKSCRDAGTCDICAEYANEIYDRWKTCKTGFFFDKVDRFDTEIYENMLDVCTLTKDCEGFKKAFMDKYKNEEEIDTKTCKGLENLHANICKTCKRKVQVHGISDGMALLSHLLNK